MKPIFTSISLTVIPLFFNLLLFGQPTIKKQNVYDLPIPKNIESCFKMLNKTLDDSDIYLIKTLEEDSIYFNPRFRYGADFFHAWKLYDGSVLTKYFNKLGLSGSHPIYETILICYHRYLNHQSIALEGQIKKKQAIQKADTKIYLEKLKKDTLNGVYIPKDLKDCFVQLDKMLSAKFKSEIKNLKNRDETLIYHHNLGMQLRNSWGLWGGSRLQKYFITKKATNPEEMSSLILEFYYDWLNNDNKGWAKWAE